MYFFLFFRIYFLFNWGLACITTCEFFDYLFKFSNTSSVASRGKFHWLTPAKENTNQDPSSRPCLINSRLINSWKVLISYWQLTAGEFWQMVSALSYGIPVIFKTKNNKNWWISCTVAWNHAQIIYFFVLFQLLINQDFHCTALLDLA